VFRVEEQPEVVPEPKDIKSNGELAAVEVVGPSEIVERGEEEVSIVNAGRETVNGSERSGAMPFNQLDSKEVAESKRI
jgi:hypothetical protein